MPKLICFHCQSEIHIIDRVGFRDECTSCREDVHVCKNCQFYDAQSYNECKETNAEVIKEKQRANYCEYFSPRGEGSQKQDNKTDLFNAAEALFKKS